MKLEFCKPQIMIMNKCNVSNNTLVDRERNRTCRGWSPWPYFHLHFSSVQHSPHTLQVRRPVSALWLWCIGHILKFKLLCPISFSQICFLFSLSSFLSTYVHYFSPISSSFLFPYFSSHRRGITEGRYHWNNFAVRVKVHILEYLIMTTKTVSK